MCLENQIFMERSILTNKKQHNKHQISATLIQNQRELSIICKQLQQQKYIAIDLESDMNKRFGRNF